MSDGITDGGYIPVTWNLTLRDIGLESRLKETCQIPKEPLVNKMHVCLVYQYDRQCDMLHRFVGTSKYWVNYK